MSTQIDYQILLKEAVRAAKFAAEEAIKQQDGKLLFAYYDVLDAIKTQAEIMEVPLIEIGLDDIDLDEYLNKSGMLFKQKAA